MLLPSGFHSHGEAIAKHLRPSQVKGLALWVGGTILAHSNCQNTVLGVSEVYRDLAIPVAPQYCGRLSRRRSLRGAAALRCARGSDLPDQAAAGPGAGRHAPLAGTTVDRGAAHPAAGPSMPNSPSGVWWPARPRCWVRAAPPGLGDYEVCSWQSWHRHMTLCLLLHSCLLQGQLGLKKTAPPDPVPDGRGPGAPAGLRGPPCRAGRSPAWCRQVEQLP